MQKSCELDRGAARAGREGVRVGGVAPRRRGQ